MDKKCRVLFLHELEHARKLLFLHLCTFNKTELILCIFCMRFPQTTLFLKYFYHYHIPKMQQISEPPGLLFIQARKIKKLKKKKKKIQFFLEKKVFLIFRVMELFSPKIKNYLIFSQKKKSFSYISENRTLQP